MALLGWMREREKQRKGERERERERDSRREREWERERVREREREENMTILVRFICNKRKRTCNTLDRIFKLSRITRKGKLMKLFLKLRFWWHLIGIRKYTTQQKYCSCIFGFCGNTVTLQIFGVVLFSVCFGGQSFCRNEKDTQMRKRHCVITAAFTDIEI